MSEYFNEIIKIGYFIGLSFILALILLGAVYIISFTSKIDFEKSSAYECGFQPFSETSYPFQVQFALIGILFLLFDIEILYLYPICTSILGFNTTEIIYLIIFFGIVVLGLLYEISRNIVNFFNYELNEKDNLKLSFSLIAPFSDFDSFMFLIILFTLWLLFYLIKKSVSVKAISSVIILLFANISIFSPTFTLVFMVLFSSVILVIMFPFKLPNAFLKTKEKITSTFIFLLYQMELLDFLSVVYIKFFCVPSRLFHLRLLGIFICSVIYMSISRWYFYHNVILHESFSFIQYLLIYFWLILGISIIYLRLLINLSCIFIPLTLRLDPSLLSPSVLYVFGENNEDALPTQQTPKPSNKVPNDKRYSFINVNNTRKYYRQYFNASHSTSYRNIGLCIGVCGVGLAGLTAYFAKVQADVSTIQANESKKQSYHTAREADVAAVEANLITREEYYRRHPEDKPSSI